MIDRPPARVEGMRAQAAANGWQVHELRPRLIPANPRPGSVFAVVFVHDFEPVWVAMTWAESPAGRWVSCAMTDGSHKAVGEVNGQPFKLNSLTDVDYWLGRPAEMANFRGSLQSAMLKERHAEWDNTPARSLADTQED